MMADKTRLDEDHVRDIMRDACAAIAFCTTTVLPTVT